jgi:hypothetical protein
VVPEIVEAKTGMFLACNAHQHTAARPITGSKGMIKVWLQ